MDIATRSAKLDAHKVNKIVCQLPFQEDRYEKLTKCLFLPLSAESHQVLAQLLDTLLVIGTQLPESPTVRLRLIQMACKVTRADTW